MNHECHQYHPTNDGCRENCVGEVEILTRTSADVRGFLGLAIQLNRSRCTHCTVMISALNTATKPVVMSSKLHQMVPTACWSVCLFDRCVVAEFTARSSMEQVMKSMTCQVMSALPNR
jgi:hypothetical protein